MAGSKFSNFPGVQKDKESHPPNIKHPGVYTFLGPFKGCFILPADPNVRPTPDNLQVATVFDLSNHQLPP